MAEDNEKINLTTDSINIYALSERERKLTIITIIFFSVLIIVLLALIAEAFINQHPVFIFLQYKYFKPKNVIIGSLSSLIFYIGILLLCIADSLFKLEGHWKSILLILILMQGNRI